MATKAETLRARAARGAKFLDEKMPGWHRKVKLTRLDMACPFIDWDDPYDCGCIGAQLSPSDSRPGEGSFNAFLAATGLAPPARVRLGFEASRKTYARGTASDEFAVLTEAWADEIRARR